jgi:glycosyltransferase involved in cell wall biosynthesis/Flp pilus assembly protein TadD/LPS sulfotransferase NodH
VTRVSLCIVARDEARFLPGCIASARAVVDEIIVVDTGSTDGSLDLARAAGAQVFVSEWPGDLGAAHDLPLARASGDWILSLDADETLDPASQAVLRRLVEGRRGVDGFRVSIRNYIYGTTEKARPVDPADPLSCGASAYRPTAPVRLFRRQPGLRFTGRLHQSIAVSIERRGGRLQDSPIVIHHYGLLRPDRSKTPFYRALARRQAAAAPTHAGAWIELGATFTDDEDRAAALHTFQLARRLGRRAVGGYLMGATILGLGAPAAAEQLLTRALRGNGRDQSHYFDRADALELLGEAYETLERPRAAERAYRRALALRPWSLAVGNNLAALLDERGCDREAEALLSAMIEREPGASAPRATLGALLLRRRDPEGARRWLESALDVEAENPSARVNLGLAHAMSGRPRSAARAFAAAWDLRGGDVVRQLGFTDLLPPPPRRPPLRPMPTGGVVSVIGQLYGGSARVLVDVVQALPRRSHLVLCGDAGAFTRQGLRAELEAAGAEVRTVGSPEHVRSALRAARPSVVIHHWWENSVLPSAERVADERWIAVGHSPQPMPPGYDAYVLGSEFHARSQLHLPADRKHSIPNGVNLRRVPRKRASGAPVTIVMLSRLEPSKFPRRLLAYLPPLREMGARLLIAGKGGRRFEIEQDKGLARFGDSVRFVGAIPSSRVPALLAQADIGLHLTEMHEEICSLAILEMLAAGLPVVAEPKGCLPQLVVSEKNGFLAEREDEIAERLTRLIESPALRRQMGAASRAAARAYGLGRFRSSVRALVSATERRTPVGAAAVRRRSGTVQADRRLEPWTPHTSILLCTSPGPGGGSHLCRALWRIGVAGRPAEYFEPRAVRIRLLFSNGGGGFAGYLAQALEEGSSPNGVFAARLLQPHALALTRRAGRASSPKSGAARETLRRWFPGLRVVWARRRGAADQEGTASWQRLFATWNVEPVVVWEEDLAHDPVRTIRRLVERLGLEAPSPYVFDATRLAPDAGV